MKNFVLMLGAVVLGLTLNIGDAEAKRLGGGGSSGMQRQAISPSKPTQQAAPTPAPQQAAAPAAIPAQPQKRSWLGPIAGLAAGLGLAALASHFGFGEELANFMMMALLAVAVLAVVGYFLRKKAAAQQPAMQYAGGGYDAHSRDLPPQYPAGAAAPVATAAGPAGNIPASFDVAGFVRHAKVNFIRLQAANDAGNLDDIREFTSPEMFAEIKLAMGDRGATKQETDVQQLEAEVLDVAEDSGRYVVSVRFHGLIREESDAVAQPFDEVWHMTKPLDGSRGWVLSGIQQVQ